MNAPLQAIPKLRNGDRLNANEFWRRYRAMPGVKAELIGGTVHMPSPVSHEEHGGPHAELAFLLMLYKRHTPGLEVSIASTVRLGEQSAPEPDLTVRIVSGGGSRTVDGYITGSPELAVEISASSVSIDRHAKYRDYQEAGVQEYVIWRTEDAALDWFTLEAGQYVPLTAGEDGILRSRVFPGLWLDPTALLAGDERRVEDVLRQGLASAEHAAFVARLGGSP